MNPSPAAIALIRERVTDWTPDDASIAAMLNVPSVANPTQRPTVAKPFTARDLMGVLGQPEQAKLLMLPSLARLLDDIVTGSLVPLENWVIMLRSGDFITQEQAAGLFAIIQATEPDPSWQPQISWAEAVIGRLVDADDIAAARPGDAQ